jgi:hypothetical protein
MVRRTCFSQVPALICSVAVSSERVWNNTTVGTKGGISDVFAVPTYQANAALPQSVSP